MKEQEYRGHLIRVIATKTPGYWVARTDVRFDDDKGRRFLPLEGQRDTFVTKEAAENYIIKAAQFLIDSRTSTI